jgi:hypothetical protein
MRAMRAWLAVAAIMALDVSAAAAQSTRHFKDSWFWGLKGGATLYQVQSNPNALAPMAGADWLITRTKGGLYVSFDHSFFTSDTVFVNDSLSPLDTVPRMVLLGGLRRFTIAGMLFPIQSNRVHPYLGIGATMNHIASAAAQGTYRNQTQAQLVDATVAQFRSAASPIFILGTQLRLPGMSFFFQATASPANANFFLFNGSNWRTTGEAGLRYNVGSSIDPMR